MPRAKTYPGVLYINKRWANKRQHVVAWYKKGHINMLVGTDTIDLFAKELKKRVKERYQNVIVVEGGTGSGKSSAAITLAKAMDPNWSITDNYIYDLGDLRKKLSRAEAGEKVSPISLFDEAVVTLNSRNASRNEDKSVLVLFNTMRSLGWTTILCIPSIFDLNKSLRTTHVDYKVRCPDRPPVRRRGMPKRGFLEFSKAKRKEFTRDAEPYWYLFAAGIYPPMKKEWDEEYQKLKRAKQSSIIQDFIQGAEGE